MRSLAATVAIVVFAGPPAPAADWPEWRGAARDGASPETQLPSRWSPAGEGLAWKAPFGSRSAPVIFGNRLYLWNASVDTVKERDKVQERLLALDADTGKVIWERRFNVFHTDVPVHRVAWVVAQRRPGHGQRLRVRRRRAAARARRRGQGAVAAPAHRGVRRDLDARRPHRIAGHRGRRRDRRARSTPAGATSRAAATATSRSTRRRARTVWISTPQPKHYDTNYSTPTVVTKTARRLLVVGGSDGDLLRDRGARRGARSGTSSSASARFCRALVTGARPST